MQNDSYVYQQLTDRLGISILEFFDSKLIFEGLMHDIDLNMKLYASEISQKMICDMTESEYNIYRNVATLIDELL
jgi:hypothetical protein